MKLFLEIGYNHQGSLEKAKCMIDEAAQTGVYGVKFQKWDYESFPDYIKNQARNDVNSFGRNYYEHRKALEFTITQIKELKKYSEKKGLKFACSGKDIKSLKQLVDIGVNYIKVPSQRYKDHEIFTYLHRARSERNFKIITSCGMHNDKEILNSRWIECADIFLYCNSLYPPKKNNTCMGFMRSLYGSVKSLGYSAHEKDLDNAKLAVVMGAEYIERHFTLDKNAKGTDHRISSNKNDITKFLTEVKELEGVLGDGTRKITEEQKKLRDYYTGF